MSTSAAIVNPLLRRASGPEFALEPSPYCHEYASGTQDSRAGLATRLSDFATTVMKMRVKGLAAKWWKKTCCDDVGC